MNLRKVSNPLLLGVILCVTGVIAAGLLAWFYAITEAPIVQSKAQRLNDALGQVVPAFDNNIAENKFESNGIVFYGAMLNGELVGVVAEAATDSGYAGRIAGLVGLSPTGEVLELKGGRSAVLITEQSETPGLGTNVTDRKSVRTLMGILRGEKSEPGVQPANRVLDSFVGKGVADAPLAITKNGGTIEYITGATITSNAVTRLVNAVLAEYGSNSAAILAALTGKEVQ